MKSTQTSKGKPTYPQHPGQQVLDGLLVDIGVVHQGLQLPQQPPVTHTVLQELEGLVARLQGVNLLVEGDAYDVQRL